MKMLKDLKIGKRLGLGFGSTLALMVVIVTGGIVCLATISTDLDRIVVVNNVKLKHANDIRIAFANITSLIGEIVSTDNKGIKEECMAKIIQQRTVYKGALEGIEKLETAEEGKELITPAERTGGEGQGSEQPHHRAWHVGKPAGGCRDVRKPGKNG